MYKTNGCLGLAFRNCQPECAYPIFPGVCFLRLALRMCISDGFLGLAFQDWQPELDIRFFLPYVFLDWPM